jgi:nucleoid-associated protein YgaU
MWQDARGQMGTAQGELTMAETSMGARAVALLLGAGVAGGIGYAVWQTSHPAVAPVTEVAADAAVTAEAAPAEAQAPAEAEAEAEAAVAGAAVAPVAEAEATPDPAPDVVVPEVAAVAEPVAPALDVVRVDADGATLIAGKAGANARVSLRLDGIEESVTQADSAGNFVAQFTLQPNPSPRMLTVAVLLDAGGEVPGGAAVAIAPIAAPAVVAAQEPQAPAAIMVTEDAVSIVQDAVPLDTALPANVTVDTIAYAPDGAVLLSGKGEAAAGVRLYLDNAPTMDAKVGADGTWAVTLPDTAPGIYTLRVDQVAGDGVVTSRFETPFKRETLAALAQASGQAAPVTADPAPEAVAAAEPVAVDLVPEPVVAAEPLVEAAPEAVVVVEEPVVEPAPEVVVTAPAAEPVVAEPAAPAVQVAAEPAAVAPVTITVQPGFTLWGIADSMMGDGIMYVQVYEMNKDKIRNPDLIYPGQVFAVPQE